MHAPRHPVPSMRAAFEESVIESDGTRSSGMNSSSRRRRRMKHHRLRKLVAQIAFGLYLLHDGLAKSDAAVVRILQGHINDMDEFLSVTTADFEAAKRDISARLRHLQVPLDEKGGVADVFDKMLESREFRREMMGRNELVDLVVQRTTAALQASLRDVREGLAAVDELAKYLLELHDGWRKDDLKRVYTAMTHNVALWFRCCVGLQMKGARLGTKLNQLQAVVHEIEQRTAAASRKYKGPAIMITGQNGEVYSPLRSPPLRSPMSTGNIDKPLPEPPRPTPAIEPFEIQIPHRTSSRPKRRLSKSKSSPQMSAINPLPESLTFPAELASPKGSKAPRRSLSMRFRQRFRGSKSMNELTHKIDKGKQREVPLPLDDTPVVAMADVRNGNANANALKRHKSRLLRWTTTRESRPLNGAATESPRIKSIKSAATYPGGLLRRISTLVMRRNNRESAMLSPQLPVPPAARRARTTLI